MGELKKTFLAGLGVLMVLLLAPYYLQLIGYTVADDNIIEVVEENFDIQQPITGINKTPIKPAGINTIQPPLKQISEQIITINTNLYSAQISNFGGGSFVSFHLNEHKGSWNEEGSYIDTNLVELISDLGEGSCAPCLTYNNMAIKDGFHCSIEGFSESINSFYLEEEGRDSLNLVCLHEKDGILIEKKTTFHDDSFLVNHRMSINSGNIANQASSLGFFWDKGINNTEKNLYDDISYSGVSFSANKEIETTSFTPSGIEDSMETLSSGTAIVDWAAMRNKYFILAVLPQNKKDGFSQVVFNGSARNIAKNSLAPVYTLNILKNMDLDTSFMAFNTYLGPLDIDYINNLDTTLDRIMNFGWFIIQPFSRGILWLLKSLHSLGLNYGVILILFAFLVRIVTGPLTKKSFESTQNMQAIQPKLKKIQDKYKSDPQKLNTEMVKLYRDNGVNPLGGCLPMLLQMPLLFSLFLVFRSTIEFRGAPFIWWIKDLSLPDTIINLPITIPIYGDQIAFLPLLLGISMFLTQKMSMANMDTGMGQQKYMMYFMSAFFFLIFNSFPSGLNLYYLVYNILNYLQQKSLKKT